MLKAGSYRGNDLFHCIIHLIDYASLDTQADIDATFFENMLEEFADYYGIKNLTRDEIATLLKGFPHPFDREILLGEVLKRVFNKSLPNEKRSDSDELLKSEALRAFLTGIAGKWTYENGVITESISKMKIIHKDNGYFFNCGDDGDNDLYENLMNQPDAQLPEIVAGFRDKE